MPKVIVIGASRGIGRGLVEAYARDGWEVVATVRSAGAAADLRGMAGVTVALADTSDEATLNGLAAAIGEPADVLIVNAGVGATEARLSGVEAAKWVQVMTVNALGPLLVARALGAGLKDGGSFVALSSAMGSIADNGMGGAYTYRMSKAALNMGLSSLALEWKRRGIAVAALHPGWVKTDMGGAGAPVEIADSVAGLLQVVAGLDNAGGVAFLDYQGRTLPW